MHTRFALAFLASLGAILTSCAPPPAKPRGMFDLSTMPASTTPSQSQPFGHGNHAGGSGLFSSGIGGGAGQGPGAIGGGGL